MEKRKLIVAAIDNYPALNPCFNMRTLKPTTDCPMPGMFIEVNILCQEITGTFWRSSFLA
jgi:hypothetical protein